MPDRFGHDLEWYVSILNSISDLILVKGNRSKLLWANRAFLEYYGMSNNQLRDIVDAEHSDPDDTVQYVRDDHHVFTTGETLLIEAEPVTNAQGKTAYYQTVKNPIRDEQGQIEATVGISRLISNEEMTAHFEQSRNERKSSLAELRMFVRHIPLAVAMLDVKKRILCSSMTWSSYFESKEVDSEPYFDLLLSDKLPLNNEIDVCIDSAEPKYIDEMNVGLADGTRIIAQINIQPWFLPTQDVGGVIVLVHDITRTKAAERELQQRNEELIQFNYRVSHDLLAPLRTVRGYLEICEREIDRNTDKVRQLHGRMKSNVDSLSRLIRDMLDLARSDVHNDVSSKISIVSLIDTVCELHQNDIDKTGVYIKKDLQVESIYSSELRVRQILENLISNAIKYHDPKKTVRNIHVKSYVCSSDVCIDIEDNGIGFDSKIGRSIFELFVRGGSKHPGSGLGLYLVKKHIEKLGGSVSAESTDLNTVFRVKLPAHPEVLS